MRPVTHNRKLQQIIREYREAGQQWPPSTHDIARWAIETKRWIPYPADIEAIAAKYFSAAMAEEYHRDPQGREVRTMHAVRRRQENGQMEFVWDDMRTADRAFLAVAFRLRRNQIAADCDRLSTDVASCNENRFADNPIQMSFDFNPDLAQFAAARELEALANAPAGGEKTAGSLTEDAWPASPAQLSRRSESDVPASA